jgi:hypothetical protein
VIPLWIALARAYIVVAEKGRHRRCILLRHAHDVDLKEDEFNGQGPSHHLSGQTR